MSRFKIACLTVLIGLILPGWVYAREEPSLYPVNALVFKQVRPDGKELPFVRSVMDYYYIEGANGWCGKIKGRKAVVSTGVPSDLKAAHRYEFESGLLVAEYKNGVKTGFKPGKPEDSFRVLFPDDSQTEQMIDKARARNIWKGDGRLAFFSSNPNKSGTFLAGFYLLFLVLAVSKLSNRALSYGAGMLAAVFGVALLFTLSRGAFLGAVFGTVMIVAVRFRNGIPWKKVLVAIVVLALAVTSSVCLDIGDRLTKDLFKTGGTNAVRVDILKNFPRMLADAPGGWGLGNSGAAYCMWYKDQEVPNRVRALLNSHFTWLAEFGSVARFAYVFGLLLLLLILTDLAWRRRNAFPLACVGSLFVSAMFNHVMEDWLCVALPAIAAVYGLCMARKISLSRLAVFAGCAGAVAYAALFVLVSVGTGDSRDDVLKVHYDGSVTTLSGTDGKSPDIWVVGDEFVLGGWDFIGTEFRSHYQSRPDAPAVAYVERIEDVPERVRRLVLAGRSAEKYLNRWKNDRGGLCVADATLMLSPSVPLVDFPEDLAKTTRMRGIVGSLAARRVPRYAERGPDWLRISHGCLLYIPRWLPIAAEF